MGKGKQKQKSALKLGTGHHAKPKLTEPAKPANIPSSIDPTLLRKLANKKVENALNSNFQRQVLSLHERNYRNIQFGKNKSNGTQVGGKLQPSIKSEVHIATATFVVPVVAPVKNFSETDALFINEKMSEQRCKEEQGTTVDSVNTYNKPLSSNPFQQLEEEDPLMAVKISAPTFSFRRSTPIINEDDL